MRNIFKELAIPTVKELFDFSSDPAAVKAANSAIDALCESIGTLSPYSIAAIARQHFPGETLQMAITNLDMEIQQACVGIASHSAKIKAVINAEHDRLEPAVSSAVRRTFAIGERVEQIAAAITRAKLDNEMRRAKMQEAMMSEAEIESMAPAVVDTSDLLAERECLNAELNILNAFISTGDESCLPDGFLTVTEPVKVSSPEKLA